jgi:ATP-dependent Clp protease ATP-binding subunit ClpC
MFGLSQDFFRDPNYRFHQAIVLEHVFPGKVRMWLSVLFGTIVCVYLGVMLAPLAVSKLQGMPVVDVYREMLPAEASEIADRIPLSMQSAVPNLVPFVESVKVPLDPSSPIGGAIFMFSLAIWLVMRMLTWYGRSYYFHVEALLERGSTGAQTPYTTPNYEVCDIYYRVAYGDLLKSYLESPYGRTIMHRSGISDDTIASYLSKRERVVNYAEKESELRSVFTLLDLSKTLVALDPDFYQFLFELGVRERELAGATEWVERQIKKKKQKQRYWGKVSLGQAPAFGADLAYGGAYALGKYSHDLSKQAVTGGSSFHFIYGNEQIKALEIVLARAKEANAILVGEEGSGKMDVILDFARDIMNGYINPALAHKRVMAFDAKTFASNMRTKQDLELGLIKIMNDTVKAGNIILVIEDLPGFIQSGLALDADVMGVIDPFLSGTSVQMIATADNARFHQFIEPNSGIMQRFEKVMLTEPAEESLIRIIEEVAEGMERKNHIYFTFPAIVEVIRSAQNYFSDGIMPDKAIDLLVELTPSMLSKGGHLVKKLDVLEFVKEKTNIPVGAISEEERDRLLHLEAHMKKLVIGQEQALDVVANAMRRARAGVRSMNRPIGAFLFLGPTGVGKTETAKALATVFFGNENAMSRLDMSEYQGDDGLNRIIGSMDGTAGVLPVMLKEQPYGVILLDEFEKTNVKVLDLFLQVLDEGVFHDAQGRKVNARNSIFIATSNAGAPIIRQAIKEGRNLADAQKDITDEIIAQGKLKPELFNRFDGIVLFHPLTREDYLRIADIMLRKLQKRLRDKSINLVINDVLIEAVMLKGVDPDMGARPMTRAVQEVVEQRVAEKIISGKVMPGQTLEFAREDFPELGPPPPASMPASPPLSPLEQALSQIPEVQNNTPQ